LKSDSFRLWLEAEVKRLSQEASKADKENHFTEGDYFWAQYTFACAALRKLNE